MKENNENVEIIDYDENKPQENENIILDNSVVQPEVFQNLSEDNVANGINAINQTENILNESIKNNLGNDIDLQNFNNLAASLQEDKKELDSGVLETEKWFRQSQEKKETKTTFNAAINPTINNISNTISFEKPIEMEVKEEVQEEVVDNTDKNKKGIAFIVILFIILFAFVFALPYITNTK